MAAHHTSGYDWSKLAPVRGVLVLVAAAGRRSRAPPSAGRTPYGWLYGTEVMPERGAEIQTWVAEKNGEPPDDSTTPGCCGARWSASPIGSSSRSRSRCCGATPRRDDAVVHA